MSIGVALSVFTFALTITQALTVAAFARTRGRRELYWFAASCLAVAFYSLATILMLWDEAEPWMVSANAHTGMVVAGLYLVAAWRYAQQRLPAPPSGWRRFIEPVTIALVLVCLIPGVTFHLGGQRVFTVAHFGTYHVARPTPAVFIFYNAFGLALFGSAEAVVRTAATPRIRRIHLAAYALYLVASTNDVLVHLGLNDGPFVGTVGFGLIVLSTSFEIAEQSGVEAKKLAALRTTLEHQIEERGAALAAARQELADNERLAALGRLAAGIGHEINNPLTYVLGNLRDLRDQPSPKEDQQRLDDALDGVDRISNIVDELRVLARRDVGPVAPQEVADVLQAAVRLSHQNCPPLVEVTVETTPDVFVDADASRLTQAFVNLLRNAFQAIPSDGAPHAVTVVMNVAPDEVVVRVSDDGVGMPPTSVARLFEPFQSTKESGLGLGLVITREIVGRAGGTITVESEVGAGTTFAVRLPRVARPSPVPQAPPATTTRSSLEGRRVLVVDDDQLVARVVARMLAPAEVEVVSCVEEARHALEQGAFDAIVCDLMMPDETGIDLWRELRSQQPDLAERFVLVTGGVCDDDAREVLESGSLIWLSKPVRRQQLVETVSRVAAQAA